jgi:3-deoxy-manno-octulosonate cytidylyltransferase (CMP-KDO synthetase)
VIPARYASTRLPGKPLLDIGGQPMIQHTWMRARESGAAQVVIATDDQRIADVARGFGADVCMTSNAHESGTDRIAEVARQLDWADADIVVNLQGDEPLMPPALLDQVAAALGESPDASMSTLAVQLDAEQVFDSNAVKVVCDRHGMALYFSRASIPWKRGQFEKGSEDARGMLRHLGIYAYRVGFLHRYVTWAPAPLEQQESLEQLRVLWNGERVVVDVAAQAPPPGVDSEADYQRLLRRLG